MKNYEETLKYLYEQLPMFQRIGGSAYKAGLETSLSLANMFDNPQQKYRTIHVAGTNGKGSVSHLIAAILQENGYKVGLYTSPHLVDFRERIRVNGKKIPQENVVDFVVSYKSKESNLKPSFFELTMMMAFDYFSKEKVDIAIIEVGLGGRLDSTNIINPDLSIITNISFDHTQFLGETLPKIASEKAGIIKRSIPVVIGEAIGEVKEVFEIKAKEENAPIIFSEDNPQIKSFNRNDNDLFLNTNDYGIIRDELSGDCQIKNANTVLNAVQVLKGLNYNISANSVKNAFENVCELTGLMGRWMKIQDNPITICDTGHNVGGFTYITEQLQRYHFKNLRIIIGFVNDKDIDHILEMMPKKAIYYFTQADIPRALSSKDVKLRANRVGLIGESFNTVKEAYDNAINESETDDFVYIGGSTFIVADLLSALGY